MERILIVDDTDEFRITIATILKKHGYEVSEASSGREAIEKINVIRPQLILLDVIMPEMDGMCFLNQLNAFKDFDKTPVILLTGLVIQDSLAKSANDRIVDCLVKAQFSVEDLLEKVRDTLDASEVKHIKPRSAYEIFSSH